MTEAMKDMLEKTFADWYDTRKSTMPPAAFESWLAGYEAAKGEGK